MPKDYARLCVEVRARLYQMTVTELGASATKCLSKVEAGATKTEVLSQFEDYIGNLAKEEDGGIVKLTELLKLIGSHTTEAEPKAGTYMFRKDFKISGQIDVKTGLSYLSYCRQVSDGERKGYKESEIIDGVIRAISPQNSLRSYLEGRAELKLSEVNQIIRSYYKEKTATELYQKLSNIVQEPRETPQDFVFRSLDLRQKILFASKECSEMKYDETLVRNMTRHAILTGLKDDNIRQGFEPTLLREHVTDEEMINVLNTITSRDQERKTKMEKKTVRVNKVEVEEAESEQGKAKKTFKEGALNLEVKALRAEIDVLRQEMNRSSSEKAKNNDTTWKKKRCQWCVEKGEEGRCDHCFRCGSREHFSRGCRQRKQQQEN